jgi:hypothetical protein
MKLCIEALYERTNDFFNAEVDSLILRSVITSVNRKFPGRQRNTLNVGALHCACYVHKR